MKSLLLSLHLASALLVGGCCGPWREEKIPRVDPPRADDVKRGVAPLSIGGP